MLVHFYFSNNTLIDLIRYRVLDAYRPVVPPANAPGLPFMDGLENVQLKIFTAPQPPTADFLLNIPGSTPGQIVPSRASP